MMFKSGKLALAAGMTLLMSACVSGQALVEETFNTFTGRGPFANKTAVQTVVITTGLVKSATSEYLEGLSVAYSALDLKEEGVKQKLEDLRLVVAESEGFSAAANDSARVLEESDKYAVQLENKIRNTRIDQLTPAARAELLRAGEKFEVANYIQTKATAGAINLGYRLAHTDARREALSVLSGGRIFENMETLTSFPQTVMAWSTNISRSEEIVTVMRETKDFNEALAAKEEVVSQRGRRVVAVQMENDDPFQ